MNNSEAKIRSQMLTGCCPNRNPFERSLKRFFPTNLGEAEDKRCQLFEPEGGVLTSPGVSLRFVKNVLDQAKRDFGNSLSRPDTEHDTHYAIYV
jgi:hypothetical protein